jgi:hypothetical protein
LARKAGRQSASGFFTRSLSPCESLLWLRDFALSQNLPRYRNRQVIIKQLARPAVPRTHLLAELTVNQSHQPLRRLILGRIVGGNIARPTRKGALATKKASQIALRANLSLAQRLGEQEHQTAAVVRQLEMPGDQPLAAINQVLQALIRDLAIGHDLDEIANDSLAAIDPHRRMLNRDAMSCVRNDGHIAAPPKVRRLLLR